MNTEELEEEVEVEETEKENILERLDPTKHMNRKQLRAFGRLQLRKVGTFTKPSLGTRSRKRRAVKKVGNATRKAQR